MRSAAAALALIPLLGCGDAPLAVRGSSSGGLVFARLEATGQELARARLGDGAVRSLTASADADESWPYWSDAARRLVFQRGATGQSGSAPDLWLWSPDDAAPTALTRTPRRHERWPVWSPAGPRLAYVFRGGQPPSGVAVFDVSTPDAPPRLLARAGPDDPYLRPEFAPDGRHLVAQRRHDLEGRRRSSLWVLSFDTSPRALTTGADGFDLKAHFTRDGGRVVFTRRAGEPPRERVVSVAADGSDLREHAAMEGADAGSARPSPTRGEIAFVVSVDGHSEVYRVDLAGGAPRNLTATPDLDEYAPRWSPDGERLVVTATPAAAGRPRLDDRETLARTRLRVLDREGHLLWEGPGFMGDWMPAW